MKETSNKKKAYESPQLTVVTFKAEQGYAASTKMFWEEPLPEQMENYETRDNWHSGGQFWN